MATKTEEKYIEIMRRKSGEERLKIAMELRELVLELAKENIKSQNPKISSGKLKALLQERIYGLQPTRHPTRKKHGFSFSSKNSSK